MWIPLIYPILIGGLAMYFFKHRVLWWEAVIPMGVVVVFIALYRFGVETTLTYDTEYWGGTVEKVEYYEDWNEYIHRTCYRTVSCGKNCTRTESYDCSYVQYHSAYYKITDNNGFTARISKSKYESLAVQFKQQPQFVDLHRHYYTNDGDKYQFFWQGEKETFEPMVTDHSYENRVQASHSVYNYPEVTEEEQKKYQLHEYPEISKNKLPAILTHHLKNLPKAEKEFTWLNSSLGKKKQLRVWVCLFKNQPKLAGQMQERLWKGGNKNEFVICIGVDEEERVNWCHNFSWSEAQEPKITIRDFVMEQDTLNLVEVGKFAYKELDEKFKRKHFSEFSYLDVEPTPTSILWCHIISFLISIGISLWSLNNEVDANSNAGVNFFNRASSYHRERRSALRKRMDEMNRRKW